MKAKIDDNKIKYQYIIVLHDNYFWIEKSILTM